MQPLNGDLPRRKIFALLGCFQTSLRVSPRFTRNRRRRRALKPAAIAVGDDLPRTHVLNDLAQELVREGYGIPADMRQHLRVLERLYAPTRYPDALGGIDPNRVFVAADAVDAAARAEAVLSFVDSIVASALD